MTRLIVIPASNMKDHGLILMRTRIRAQEGRRMRLFVRIRISVLVMKTH